MAPGEVSGFKKTESLWRLVYLEEIITIVWLTGC